MTDQWPAVSIVVPVLNEEAFILQCIQALQTQDYSGEIEILLVDGMSNDNTRNLILQTMRTDTRLRLIDNPRRIIPVAINMGVKTASHELVIRMDAHSIAASDHVRTCVVAHQVTGADHVGGYCSFEGDTYLSRAIAAVMRSRFGVGPALWRNDRQAGDTDTVPYGLWRRSQFLALGGFNERLLINEDYEFNHRLRLAGGRVYFSPDIKCDYFVRRSITALARQYFRYGFWKVRMLKLFPGSIRWRQIVPPLFTAGLVVGPLFASINAVLFWVFGAAVAIYGMLTAVFSIRQAGDRGWDLLPMLPMLFIILHLSWGLGFWAGIWRWVIMREDEHEQPA
jgi:glycosyltransferase involved in cell wall biosynthesis